MPRLSTGFDDRHHARHLFGSAITAILLRAAGPLAGQKATQRTERQRLVDTPLEGLAAERGCLCHGFGPFTHVSDIGITGVESQYLAGRRYQFVTTYGLRGPPLPDLRTQRAYTRYSPYAGVSATEPVRAAGCSGQARSGPCAARPRNPWQNRRLEGNRPLAPPNPAFRRPQIPPAGPAS